MIQRLLLLCCLSAFTFVAFAQNDGQSNRGGQPNRNGQPNREAKVFSKEDFRKRQEAYLTEKAELTKQEAEKFFPLFFELQDKKKEVNDKAWKNARKGREESTTEKEYEQMVEQLIKARLESDKLDLEYLKKYKAFLSAKKIYEIQMNEIRFQREILKAVSGDRGQHRNSTK